MPVSFTQPAAPRAYAANIHRFYLYRALSNLQLWLPIWVLFLQRVRGFSLAEVGTLEIPFQLALVLASLPSGALADRYGRKLALVLGGAGFAAGIGLFGIGPSFGWILLAQLLLGSTYALSYGPDNAFLHDSLAALGRESEFTRVVGRGRACMWGAFLLGGLAGSPLAAATSLQVPILLSAGCGLLATLLVLTFREPPRHRAQQHLPYLRILREAVRYTMSHPQLAWLMLVYGLLLSLGEVSFIFLQPFLSARGVPIDAFGVATAAVLGLSVLGSLVVERLNRRLSERALFWALAAGMVGALLAIGLVPSLAVLVAFALLSFGVAALGPLASASVNRQSPDDLRATLQTGLGMVAGLVFASAAPLLGTVADHTSVQRMFLLAGGLGGVLVLATLLLWMASVRHQPEATGALAD